MESGLSYIDVPESFGPIELFQSWISEYKKQSGSKLVYMNLATASKDGYVKNRHVLLQEVVQDGLLFNTISGSPKANQMAENPNVAASFLFVYPDENQKGIAHQVRVEGVAHQMKREDAERHFNNLIPFFAQIRTLLIKDQGVEVEWADLKKQHDELLEKVRSGETELKVPDRFTVFKIVPKSFDFYHAVDNEIGDRVLFKKTEAGDWVKCHITA